jgi:hypothetical protein
VTTVERLRAKKSPTLDSVAVLMADVPAAFVPGDSVNVVMPLAEQSAVTPDATRA